MWHRRRSPRLIRKVQNLPCEASLGLGNLVCKLRRTPRDLAQYIRARRGDVKIIQYTISNPSLVRTSLGLPCNRISKQQYRAGTSPPISRRAIGQLVPLMTNPGSLTMGFSGVDPRQLAPSVGTKQVGITISAVPSSASHNSRARTRSNPPEEYKIATNISAAPSRSLGPQ